MTDSWEIWVSLPLVSLLNQQNLTRYLMVVFSVPCFFGAPKKHLWDGFRITFYEPCHTQVLTTNCFQCHHKKASPQPPTDFMRIQGHQ